MMLIKEAHLNMEVSATVFDLFFMTKNELDHSYNQDA